MEKEKLTWTPPENYTCPHCGAQNPDGGDKCGNCEKNPFELPKKDALLTEAELETLRAVTQRHSRQKPAA